MTVIEIVTALQLVGYVVLGAALSIIGLLATTVFVWDRWVSVREYALDVCERSRGVDKRWQRVRPLRRRRRLVGGRDSDRR